jgi:hypothetical protein
MDVSPGATLTWDQAQPGREMTSRFELLSIPDRRQKAAPTIGPKPGMVRRRAYMGWVLATAVSDWVVAVILASSSRRWSSNPMNICRATTVKGVCSSAIIAGAGDPSGTSYDFSEHPPRGDTAGLSVLMAVQDFSTDAPSVIRSSTYGA